MTIPAELLRSTWYGPVADASSADRVAALRTARTPDEFLLAALDAFTAGDFAPSPKRVTINHRVAGARSPFRRDNQKRD